ncbi:MAG: sensor domain-containing diguanylate cyclase [Nitrospira sp.]|nr:sensor domain-containing diguanylate cyclase [Candidatus Brocadiales bacterium]MBL7049363.1 sensor domain-containing diguanylate cyclase [Nitrospira sp.]
MILDQIFDAINTGILIIDTEFRVIKWNRWMEIHSGLSEDDIKGVNIFDKYPDLDNTKFRRSCKSVFSFGNFSFFSQKLHRYLLPFTSKSLLGNQFEFMQQSCSMGPLRDENNEIKYLFINIEDVTDVATYEHKLLEMNIKDGLTGIYNRRFLETKLEEEYKRCKRYKSTFSLIMFDLDHFKNVNDTYGHPCGDFILKMVSSRISAAIRNVDFLFRYGGEEFCCLLPETKLDAAVLVADRFRADIESQNNVFEEHVLNVTISIGVTEFIAECESGVDILKKADEALYTAKKTGRNRVISLR